MNKTIVAISKSPALRKTFRGLRLHKLYNKWLHQFPRTRVLPDSGIIYRARRTEGVSLALAILEGGNSYDSSLVPRNCATVADIGCNIGYFSCWLAHNTRQPIKGLMVDANPDVIAEARWHVQTNKWLDMHVLQGVAGVVSQIGSTEFLVHEADTVSTAQLVDKQLKHKDQYKKITAPVISVGQEWQKRMGNVRCNVLKIDIEGCELVFLQQEAKFLELVDTIFVEWHKYRVTFDELNQFLTSKRFKLEKIIEEIGDDGTAVYKRA
jgi:FkbM family methyltransferase